MAVRTPGKRTPPHLQARQRLVELIDRLSAEGIDRLPGERQLSELLAVSLNTVKKAIRQLALEDRLATAPRDGHFILGRRPATDIALILGEGHTATFLRDPEILAAVITTLHRLGCMSRMLQVRDPAEAPALLAQYRLDGAVWYMPHPTRLGAVAAACRQAGVPVATTLVEPAAPAGDQPAALFTYDHAGTGRARVEWLLARGHRRIALCARDDGAAFAGYRGALAAAGLACDRALVIPDLPGIAERLPRLLEDDGATALIADGGIERQTAIFAQLAHHPWNGRGDLLVDHLGAIFAALRQRFPLVRIAAVNHGAGPELGVCAAEALVAAIRARTPLGGRLLLPRILPFD